MTPLPRSSLIAIIVVTAVLMVQHQTQIQLREENRSFRQRVEQLSNLVARATRSEAYAVERSVTSGVPAPPIEAVVPAEPPSQKLQSNHVMARLLRGDAFPPKVRTGELESWLEENQRSAASLLASSRLTRDQTLLQEAMEKYPNDPQVAMAALFKKNSSPEERRQWLDAFKHSAPDNALANYLSAREFFKAGQIDQAVQELNAAFGKAQFQDYFTASSQTEEEAWIGAGYSIAEAKVFSAWSLLYPHLGDLERLSRDMVSLAESYRQAGDQPSAQASLQMVLNLGLLLDESPSQPYPSRKVRLEIENIALQAMDPTSFYGEAGQTVNDRINESAQQREALEELEQRADDFALRQKVPDHDWITYKDRWRAFGEEAALRWLVGKYSQR